MSCVVLAAHIIADALDMLLQDSRNFSDSFVMLLSNMSLRRSKTLGVFDVLGPLCKEVT